MSAKGSRLKKPAKADGKELWYHSPIRDGDKNPSFKIDTIKNLWFDHGVATGGNIIDLVREICSCDVRDALQHLEKSGLYSPALPKPMTTDPVSRGVSQRSKALPEKPIAEGEKEKNGALKLISAEALQHPTLLQYLTQRGIDHEVARKHCLQIDFTPAEKPLKYFAIISLPELGSKCVTRCLRALSELEKL